RAGLADEQADEEDAGGGGERPHGVRGGARHQRRRRIGQRFRRGQPAERRQPFRLRQPIQEDDLPAEERVRLLPTAPVRRTVRRWAHVELLAAKYRRIGSALEAGSRAGGRKVDQYLPGRDLGKVTPGNREVV